MAPPIDIVLSFFHACFLIISGPIIFPGPLRHLGGSGRVWCWCMAYTRQGVGAPSLPLLSVAQSLPHVIKLLSD